MQGVNVSGGLLRHWLVCTAAWLGLAAFIAWANITDTVRGRYQFIVQLKDGISNPFDAENIGKPFLEVYRKPSEGKFPPAFGRVEYRYQDGFDASVKESNMVLVDFTDSTSLYVNTAFEKGDQDLVARLFWEQRWQRRWAALGHQAGLLWFALVSPLLLMHCGSSIAG